MPHEWQYHLGSRCEPSQIHSTQTCWFPLAIQKWPWPFFSGAEGALNVELPDGRPAEPEEDQPAEPEPPEDRPVAEDPAVDWNVLFPASTEYRNAIVKHVIPHLFAALRDPASRLRTPRALVDEVLHKCRDTNLWGASGTYSRRRSALDAVLAHYFEPLQQFVAEKFSWPLCLSKFVLLFKSKSHHVIMSRWFFRLCRIKKGDNLLASTVWECERNLNLLTLGLECTPALALQFVDFPLALGQEGPVRAWWMKIRLSLHSENPGNFVQVGSVFPLLLFSPLSSIIALRPCPLKRPSSSPRWDTIHALHHWSLCFQRSVAFFTAAMAGRWRQNVPKLRRLNILRGMPFDVSSLCVSHGFLSLLHTGFLFCLTKPTSISSTWFCPSPGLLLEKCRLLRKLWECSLGQRMLRRRSHMHHLLQGP